MKEITNKVFDKLLEEFEITTDAEKFYFYKTIASLSIDQVKKIEPDILKLKETQFLKDFLKRITFTEGNDDYKLDIKRFYSYLKTSKKFDIIDKLFNTTESSIKKVFPNNYERVLDIFKRKTGKKKKNSITIANMTAKEIKEHCID